MLKSSILSGNTRLDQASNGPPSIRKRPPDDDAGAVRRIQKALVKLGLKLPNSFKLGPNAEPDGLYGPETEKAVRDFQKKAFPNAMSEWDGRCGPKTLAAMDALLATNTPPKGAYIPPRMETGVCRCHRGSPGQTAKPGARPAARPAATPPGIPIPYPNLSLKRGSIARGMKIRPIAKPGR